MGTGKALPWLKDDSPPRRRGTLWNPDDPIETPSWPSIARSDYENTTGWVQRDEVPQEKTPAPITAKFTETAPITAKFTEAAPITAKFTEAAPITAKFTETTPITLSEPARRPFKIRPTFPKREKIVTPEPPTTPIDLAATLPQKEQSPPLEYSPSLRFQDWGTPRRKPKLLEETTDSQSTTAQQQPEVHPSLSMDHTLVTTPRELEDMNQILSSQPTEAPSLFVHLEGSRISRTGVLSLLAIYVAPLKHTYLIDLVTLGPAAFSGPSPSLRTILSSPTIPKVFFDVRLPADALFHLHNVELQNVTDLQVWAAALRWSQFTALESKAQCIRKDAGMTKPWNQTFHPRLEAVQAQLDPARGGSMELWNARPLRADLVQLAIHHAALLSGMMTRYKSVSRNDWEKIDTVTRRRIKAIHGPPMKGRAKEFLWPRPTTCVIWRMSPEGLVRR